MFALCLELGFAHPRQMLRELTVDQVVDWLAYYQLNKWGATRDDERLVGLVPRVIASLLDGQVRDFDYPYGQAERDWAETHAAVMRRIRAATSPEEENRIYQEFCTNGPQDN